MIRPLPMVGRQQTVKRRRPVLTLCGWPRPPAGNETWGMSEHANLLRRHRAVMPSWMALNYRDPIEIVGGKGNRVTDAEGNSYLDFFIGILTNMLGYDVPEVRDAVERQIATGVVHTSTAYLLRGQV